MINEINAKIIIADLALFTYRKERKENGHREK